MADINKLLIKAKRLCGAERLINAFVSQTEAGKWLADGRLWNGIKRDGVRIVISEHENKEGAIKALFELAEKYPNCEEVIIFVEDVEVHYG